MDVIGFTPSVLVGQSLVLLRLPKVASTSMGAIMPELVYRTETDTAELRRLGDEGYTVACIVRRPAARLASAWRYFRTRPDEGQLGFAFEGTGLREFAARAIATPLDELNIHIRPQSLLISDSRGMFANRLLRLENIAEEWAVLQSRFDLPDFPHMNETGGGSVDPEVERMVADAWGWDCEALEYMLEDA